LKLKHLFLTTFLILMADQALKVYVKTHFHLGEEHLLFSSIPWMRLHFIENEGMAYGWKLGGDWGKLALTLFRLAAVVAGTIYLVRISQKRYHTGFMVCATLIYAGAIGNLIDSLCYGVAFEGSDPFSLNRARLFLQEGFGGGYASWLHGKVVDMLYFPIITDARYPDWVPFWGGESFEFFRPVFNIADASITTGVILLLVFQERFMKELGPEAHPTVETNSRVSDEAQVS